MDHNLKKKKKVCVTCQVKNPPVSVISVLISATGHVASLYFEFSISSTHFTFPLSVPCKTTS